MVDVAASASAVDVAVAVRCGASLKCRQMAARHVRHMSGCTSFSNRWKCWNSDYPLLLQLLLLLRWLAATVAAGAAAT